MARAGAASRRASEGLILAGRVAVNGAVVRELGTKVGEGDRVTLDGRPLRAETRRRYLALHKPPGYLCSARDPQGRPLALSLLPPDITERLYSVGRLDYLSSGLVFFTNDGAFAAFLGHPSSGIEKEYFVEAAGPVPDQTIEAFTEGIVIEGERYRARRIERLGRGTLRIVLIEGKNREIRRVFSHFHLHAAVLRRVRIGPVELGNLPEGKSRPLSAGEIAALTALRGFTPEGAG
ncbi:MAG: rRNA pseudouridine synthase [Treponema sp.]|jgi:23S rRNA pseudouridine2605 synthase|nr:rRNA pseudouridine synthase [Treponema sp.]